MISPVAQSCCWSWINTSERSCCWVVFVMISHRPRCDTRNEMLVFWRKQGETFLRFRRPKPPAGRVKTAISFLFYLSWYEVHLITQPTSHGVCEYLIVSSKKARGPCNSGIVITGIFAFCSGFSADLTEGWGGLEERKKCFFFFHLQKM